jgi:uncharacterized protein YjdB
MNVAGVRLLHEPTPGRIAPLKSITGRQSGGPRNRRLTGGPRFGLAACLTVLAACGGDSSAPPAPVASVSVTPPSSTISVGQTAQLTAQPKDAQSNNLANRTVTWSSTNTAVATVSSSGLVTALAVGGPVTIVASSEGQDGSAVVTVTPPPVATVTVAPGSPTLTPGAVIQLVPTLRDASGATLTGRTVTWSSSNNGVATVSGAGLVTGVAVGGPVTITATSEGQIGTASVSVVAPVVTTVSISPAVTTVPSGGTTPLSVIVRDQSGATITGKVPSWNTSNASIATVSPVGLVTGISAGGPVTITATVDGKSGTASITVTSSPCDASTPIAIGQTLSGALASTDCTLQDGSFMDLYQVSVTTSGRLQFDVTSTAFDAYLILFLRNADGTMTAVGSDDNSAGATNPRITRDVLAGETYLIGANSLLANMSGAYQVSVQTGTFMIVQQSVVRVRDTVVAQSKMRMAAKALR